ncbi:MAG TPA: hypothetical protein VGA65_00885 [Hyphomicrobium sp.]
MSEGVKILDAGAKLLLSGADAEELRAVLHDFIRRGAKVVSPPMQLGGKWVTACTVPTQSHPADKSDTLHVADLASPRPEKASGDDDPCKVEALGLKRIVTGPTRGLVRLKVEEMVDMGATMIGDVENVDGTWTALCDTGGMQNTGFRW